MAILQTNDIFKTELSEGQHRLSPEEIHKVQQVVYGITIDITELCSELNIPYMLTGGTALGAVRHGGFIPWDDDVDMVVERKYIERLLDAIEQRYPDRYFVEAPLRTPGYLSSFIQIHRKNTVCREYLEIPEERCGIKIVIFICVEGSCRLTDDNQNEITLRAGETVLLPAAVQEVTIVPEGQRVKLLETYV